MTADVEEDLDVKSLSIVRVHITLGLYTRRRVIGLGVSRGRAREGVGFWKKSVGGPSC